MIISKVNQCVNSQMYQIQDNIKQIPYWQRGYVGSAILKRYNVVGGDVTVVNFALRKLGVELVK